MGESIKHINLVKIAFDYINNLVPNELRCLINVDSATTMKPSKITGNFIPDVFYWHDDIMIIGEGKTCEDFERIHSKEQFNSYLCECSRFHGEAIFVIAVPWNIVATAKNYFRQLKKALACESKIVVISENGKVFEL